MNTAASDKVKQIIYTTSIETPLGTMLAAGTEKGICLLEFTERAILESEFVALKNLLDAEIEEGDCPWFEPLRKQLAEYFDGKRKAFDIPLIIPGTPFQQQVWRGLLQIPYGITRSYKEQSLALNKLDAIRAVAAANGANRIAIIIPCHRVIGENGSLTGYGGGLWRKKWLLDLEKGQITMPSL
jgi:AraC family transcriptional regulator, regulatory protein of adaptative response / methylated-DNA-[protein]-cysteine methyltransferase